MSPTQREMIIQVGSAPEDMFKVARRLPAAESAALMRYEKVRVVDLDAINRRGALVPEHASSARRWELGAVCGSHYR